MKISEILTSTSVVLTLFGAALARAEASGSSSLSIDPSVRLIEVAPSGEFFLPIESGVIGMDPMGLEIAAYLSVGNLLSPVQLSQLSLAKDGEDANVYQTRLHQAPERPVRVLICLRGKPGFEAVNSRFWVHLFPRGQLSFNWAKLPLELKIQFAGENHPEFERLIHGLLPGLEIMSLDESQKNQAQPEPRIKFELDPGDQIKIQFIKRVNSKNYGADFPRETLYQGSLESFMRTPHIQADFLQHVIQHISKI